MTVASMMHKEKGKKMTYFYRACSVLMILTCLASINSSDKLQSSLAFSQTLQIQHCAASKCTGNAATWNFALSPNQWLSKQVGSGLVHIGNLTSGRVITLHEDDHIFTTEPIVQFAKVRRAVA